MNEPLSAIAPGCRWRLHPGYELQPSSHQLDSGAMASSAGETAVAREKWCSERLGKSNIDRVIGGEIVSQLPHTRQQHIMGISTHRKNREVVERRAAPFAVDLPIGGIA